MKTKNVESKKVYTIAEGCQITGLCRNTFTRLIYSGKLKAIKVGERRWLIPCWSIDEFLQNTDRS